LIELDSLIAKTVLIYPLIVTVTYLLTNKSLRADATGHDIH